MCFLVNSSLPLFCLCLISSQMHSWCRFVREFYGASEEMNTDESWRINSTNIHLLFFHHFLSLSARTPAAGGNYDQTEKKTKSTVCFLLLSVSLISFNLFLLYFLFLVSFCAFRLWSIKVQLLRLLLKL